jgi:diketogulonate reductase-like aldo/keto reductase
MLQQKETTDACLKYGIMIESYSTLARGHDDLLQNDIILAISKEVMATPAQIILAWALHKNFIVIPKSIRRERIEENFGAPSITLSKEQVQEIDQLGSAELRTCWDPTRIIA